MKCLIGNVYGVLSLKCEVHPMIILRRRWWWWWFWLVFGEFNRRTGEFLTDSW